MNWEAVGSYLNIFVTQGCRVHDHLDDAALGDFWHWIHHLKGWRHSIRNHSVCDGRIPPHYLQCIWCGVVMPKHHQPFAEPADPMLRKLLIDKVTGKCLDGLNGKCVWRGENRWKEVKRWDAGATFRVRSVLSATTLSFVSPTWNLNWICGPLTSAILSFFLL